MPTNAIHRNCEFHHDDDFCDPLDDRIAVNPTTFLRMDEYFAATERIMSLEYCNEKQNCN